MLNRLLQQLENRPLSVWQVCLVYLTFILVRLQAEVLFLDPNRLADFFVFNIWYFFSLLLCFVSVAVALTRKPMAVVFRVVTPCSVVILVPLLDRFFYPDAKAEDLLKLCQVPLHEEWLPYLHDLTCHVLSHAFFFDSGTSLGLRLEVLLAALAIGVYVWRNGGGRLEALVKGACAYLVCLGVIYLHAVLVIAPATRRWVFPPLVVLELWVLLFRWERALLKEWMRDFAWPEVMGLSVVLVLGLAQHPTLEASGVGVIGNVLTAFCALLFFGLFLGAAKARAEGLAGGESDRAGLKTSFAPAAALLAAFLSSDGAFPAFAMLIGLVYLIWLAPFGLWKSRAGLAVLAALAVWITSWVGYSCGEEPSNVSPLPPGPSGFYASPADPSGRLGGAGGTSGALSWPPQGPPPGLRTSETAHPAWLYHPFWLALPALIALVTGPRKPRGKA